MSKNEKEQTWVTSKVVFHKDDFSGAKQYVWDGLLYLLDVPDSMKNEIYQVELTIIPQMCTYSEEPVEVGKEG